MIDDDIREQEERFYVAPATSAYKQGYDDGRSSVTGEVAEALAMLDNSFACAWSEDRRLKAALDRLRALL